jgi:two-component system, response regulator PdtaR
MVMPARTEREDLAGARVLVVEDEFIIAMEIELLLRDFGCRVLGPVRSVATAVALLGRARPDAALLDVNLLDGLAVPVAELLASMGVPFAVVSAYSPAQLDHPLLNAAPKLGKPIDERALRKALEKILSIAQGAVQSGRSPPLLSAP